MGYVVDRKRNMPHYNDDQNAAEISKLHSIPSLKIAQEVGRSRTEVGQILQTESFESATRSTFKKNRHRANNWRQVDRRTLKNKTAIKHGFVSLAKGAIRPHMLR